MIFNGNPVNPYCWTKENVKEKFGIVQLLLMHQIHVGDKGCLKVKRNNNRSEVHIWDDTNGHYTFQYKPYAYLKHASGTYRSLYGDKLKKVKAQINGKKFYKHIGAKQRKDKITKNEEIN